VLYLAPNFLIRNQSKIITEQNTVLAALLILVVGITPSLFSLWVMRQADARAQARLQLAMNSVATRGLTGLRLGPDQRYVEGLGYIIGDFTCCFNARSSYLRCAVNPSGPCHDCSYYQPKELEGESSARQPEMGS
jgi:Family of unknown function (DUF6464)